MNCVLSAKNAEILDKLCSVVKCPYIIIDTTEEVKMQLISESKNLFNNLLLKLSFFESCELHKKIFQISKPRFYFPKMLSLEIKTSMAFIIFAYEFENYFYRHKYVISDASLYKLSFSTNQSDYIDANLFHRVVSQVSGLAKISFSDSTGYVTTENTNLKFPCQGFQRISFTFESVLMKKILSINKLFNNCLLNWEDEGSPININYYGPTICAFYFLAT